MSQTPIATADAAPASVPSPAPVAVPGGPPIHSDAFRLRRFLNWFPLGLAYAFLYMGRYNLTVSKNALGNVMTKEDFGVIFSAGTLVYGVAFLLNGPLTDRIGGKRAMLASIAGTAVMNLIMGIYVAGMTGAGGDTSQIRLIFSVLYAANMYFQSFGAVAIVKVNAHWFHVRERGGFSGIFGTMISSGLFFAFTVNSWILGLAASSTGTSQAASAKWVFFAPAALLALIFVVEMVLLKDRPSQAGYADFDTGDASSGDNEDQPSLGAIVKRILTNPIILTVGLIEFCTGVLRNGIMHWYPIYAKEVLSLPESHPLRDGSWSRWYVVALCFAVAGVFFLLAKRSTRRKGILYTSGGLVFLAPFLQGGWGGLLMVAGVIGGNVAGWVSDLFFQSRRAPAAGGLYLGLAAAAVLMYFALGKTTTVVAWASRDEKAAAAGLDQLQPGDRIVTMAGVAVTDWPSVSRAFACVPAACTEGAKFDAERCLCTSSPGERVAEAKAPGPISATVVRGGVDKELRLRDPSPSMRPGDARRLKAGPVTTLSPYWLGFLVVFMSVCVIGTHGLLSGTATMDFGGRKGAATAVGLIDGLVYLGTALQSIALGYLTTRNWTYWPLFLIPFALIGFVLCTRIWHAKPRGAGGH